MLTQTVAGRTWDFSHVVGRTAEYGAGFRDPCAVTIGQGDVVYVLNRGSEMTFDVPWNQMVVGARISKLTIGTVVGDEELVSEVSRYGDAPGEYIWGAGIAVDTQGNLYLTDEWLNKVSIFDKEDNFLSRWGGSGEGDGQFNGPSGIVTDQQDNLYVVDSRNHRVQKLTKEGAFLSKWGRFGSGEGEFASPWGITIDGEGYVYVADHKNHRVQKFAPEGRFVAVFGSYGDGRGQLNHPTSVAVDPDGEVYVCDWANNRVQVFGPDGRFITSLIGEAQELSKWANTALEANSDAIKARRRAYTREPEWRFDVPMGLAFDAGKGRLVVVDTARRRLQIYNKLKGYSVPQITV